MIVVLDTNVVKDPMRELTKLLNDYKPDVVGVSLRNIDLLNPPRYDVDYYKHFRSMIKLIKKKSPASKIVVGGTGFSIFSKQIMEENKEIDFGVVSHGEATVADLMRNLGHPEKVKNLLLRDKRGIRFTGREKRAILNFCLPLPGICLTYRNTGKHRFQWVFSQNVAALSDAHIVLILS